MSLKNLNELAKESQKKFFDYKKEEVTLTPEFKQKYSTYFHSKANEKISFGKYTTVVETAGGLTITFPNQWFYIASYFIEYLVALKEYKKEFISLLKNEKNSKELIKKIKDSGIIDNNTNQKIENSLQGSNIEYFKKFLSDYNWWYGSKTIDRGDYFVSPILSLAKVVNVTQSYIADLAYNLSEKPELLTSLKNSTLSPSILNKPNEIENSDILSSDSIREFALAIFNFFYKENWDKLIEDSTVKDSKINETKYEILDYKSFNNLVGVFDSPQDKSSLSSSNTIRYFESPIHNENGKTYYFSTQWNATGDYNLSFLNLQKFIEEEYPKYKVVQENKTFKLLIKSNPFSIDNFYNDCINSNLKYSNQLITRYVSSLATKPFVLLSGLSGSGKTKLAQSFAQWICEDDKQYCIVPVGADWTNREPLLGYVNALENKEYILPENGALQLLIEANKEENENKPYFLILDEMNLSHVERYFADFLSVMESKDKFKLHSDTENEKSGVPHELNWPKNLFVVGTVNIDETTYMFSPKVLDRANAIEFRVTEKEIKAFLNSPNEINLEQLESKGTNMSNSFVEMAKNKEFEAVNTENLNKTLVKFFAELKKTGAEFGYRTGMEIHRLYQQTSVINDEVSENEKIDIAVMQKLLPKLHGSRRKLCPILEVLAKLCVKEAVDVKKDFLESKQELIFKDNDNVLYPLSLEKITRMYKGAVDNGFASYAEA